MLMLLCIQTAKASAESEKRESDDGLSKQREKLAQFRILVAEALDKIHRDFPKQNFC